MLLVYLFNSSIQLHDNTDFTALIRLVHVSQTLIQTQKDFFRKTKRICSLILLRILLACDGFQQQFAANYNNKRRRLTTASTL